MILCRDKIHVLKYVIKQSLGETQNTKWVCVQLERSFEYSVVSCRELPL